MLTLKLYPLHTKGGKLIDFYVKNNKTTSDH